MRCKACDVLLDDEESTNKDLKTSEYLDLCRTCLAAGGIISELSVEVETYDDLDPQWFRPDQDPTRKLDRITRAGEEGDDGVGSNGSEDIPIQ